MLAVGCQKEEPKAEAPQVEEVKVEAVNFKTEINKAAYAIGVSFANYLSTSIDKPSELGINLNKDMVLQRYWRRIRRKLHLTKKKLVRRLKLLTKRVAGKLIRQHKRQRNQLKLRKQVTTSVAEFAKTEGVKQTESGLLYQVMTQGEALLKRHRYRSSTLQRYINWKWYQFDSSWPWRTSNVPTEPRNPRLDWRRTTNASWF